jgi:hypothetical protein
VINAVSFFRSMWILPLLGAKGTCRFAAAILWWSDDLGK